MVGVIVAIYESMSSLELMSPLSDDKQLDVSSGLSLRRPVVNSLVVARAFAIGCVIMIIGALLQATSYGRVQMIIGRIVSR
jgi:hypothetical protein